VADDSKNAMGLGGISNTVTSINKDILQLASTIENTLLPKVNALSSAFKGMGMGGGGGGINQVMSGPGGGNANRIAMGVAAAGAAFGAMPGVPTAVMQDLLTQRASFYGLGGANGAGGVRSLQKSLAYSGTALNSMDTTNAIIAAQNAGLGGVSNFNKVMAGAAQASNLTPGIGITGATQAIAGTMNAPTTVNLARTIGINIRGADGSMMPFPQLVDKIWGFISQNSGGRGMDKKSLQYSMQPGYGVYNMLSGLFNGDPTMIKMVSDALLAKATFSGQSLGTISKEQMVQAGIQSATIKAIGNQTAAQTNLLTTTASATAGGYAGAADIGTGMNNLAAAMGGLTAALGGGKGLGTGVLGLGGGAMGSLGKVGIGFAVKSLFKDSPEMLLKLLPLLGLALETGGPAQGNMPYVVGEKGPELFIPKTDGTVIPNNMFKESGGGVSSYGAAGPKTALTDSQLKNVLKAAGFKGASLDTAFNVARMESGGRPGALNPNSSTGDYSEGLFQINMIGDLGRKRNAQYLKDYASIGYTGPQSLYNPAINAKIAYDISHGGTTWSNAWTNTARKLGIIDAGGSSMGGGVASINSVAQSGDPTAASRFAAAQAAAFGGGAGGGGNINYGGFTINVNGITDPNKVASEVKKILQNPTQTIGKK